MTHNKFLGNVSLALAAVLATSVFLVLSTGGSNVAIVATAAAILVSSLGSIVYFNGGGYRITKSHVDDTLKGMRG